jgi:probable F420-dependent oxidoreductase
MTGFLDELQATSPPPAKGDMVLSALGPKMLALAAERTAGAFPYLVPVEHTRRAREILGKGPVLVTEQAVILEREADRAREIAGEHIAFYVGLPNYTNNLRTFGFDDDDFAAGGSQRLMDALVAWGDVDAIAQRVRDHFDAGADHVCVQVLTGEQALPASQWKQLAPALIG